MRLLIIHPEGNIKNNPNLYYFCKELVKEGFEIVIYSRLRPEIYQGELFPGAEFAYFTADRLANFKQKKTLIKRGFDFVLGIDEGLIEAELLADAMGVPYAFLSYELFFDHELIRLNNATDIRNKRDTVKACRRIQFAIIQDEVRSRFLSQGYGIPKEKILEMPVAGSGIRRLTKSFYFHDKLQIPGDKRILLYMGWMDEIQMNRLCGFVDYIPEDWVLVIHSRYTYSGPIPDSFRADRIYFSLDSPIEDMDDMGQLLSGVDAGFCSYEPSYKTPYTGDNVKYIGLSSGKATTFLQYGVAVVVENMNIWDQLVPEHEIGVVLNQPSDLSALGELDIENAEKCFRFFETRLDIRNFIGPILQQIAVARTKSTYSTNKFPFYWREFVLISKYIAKNKLKRK